MTRKADDNFEYIKGFNIHYLHTLFGMAVHRNNDKTLRLPLASLLASSKTIKFPGILGKIQRRRGLKPRFGIAPAAASVRVLIRGYFSDGRVGDGEEAEELCGTSSLLGAEGIDGWVWVFMVGL